MNSINKFKFFVGDGVWKCLWASVVLGMVGFLVETSFVFVLQGFLLSIGLLQSSQTFLPEWYPISLLSSVLILLVFGLLRAGLLMTKYYFSSLTQTLFVCDQRKNLLSYGLKNAPQVSSKAIIGVFSEVTTQAGLGILCISILINTGVSALLFFGAGLRLAPAEMMIGVTLLALFMYPLKFTLAKITEFGRGLVKEWESLSDSLIRGLRNNFFLSVYRQVDPEIKKGFTSIDNHKSHYMNYSLVASFSSAFPVLIGVIVVSIITYCSVTYIHTDPIKLLSFFYIFIRLAQAASEAGANYSGLKLNNSGFKLLYDWKMRAVAGRGNQLQKESIILDSKDIEIKAKGLGFGYDEKHILFKNLNFSLKKKDVLVIKGESGVGKSSLLSLLLGLNLPTQGQLSINGIDSRSKEIDLHKILAYVGPEAYIIPGTIRENLLYGLSSDDNISDEDIWKALDQIELKDFIKSLPLQLNEILSDIPQISTGQMQRLSFARALLRKPSLVILDEATANLDSMTEKKIVENLQSLFNNSTSIIVTHKNSFDHIATQAIHLGTS